MNNGNRPDCDEDRVMAFVDGELSEEDSRWMEEHLSNCAQCREMYEEFTGVSSVLQTLPQLSAPEELVQDIIEDTKTANLRRPGRASSLWLNRWAWGAAAVLVVSLLVFEKGHVQQGSRMLVASVTAASEVEAAAFDLVFGFDPKTVDIQTVETSEATDGFLMASDAKRGELRVSMASPESIDLGKGKSIVRIPVEVTARTGFKSEHLRLETVRAYGLDGKPVSITLDKVVISCSKNMEDKANV